MQLIDYNQAQRTLSQACERYLSHNKVQLDALIPTSPWNPDFIFFERVLGQLDPGSGFLDWISCKYAEFIDRIIYLNFSNPKGCYYHHEDDYSSRGEGLTFLTEGLKVNAYNEHQYVDSKRVLERLAVLVGLLRNIIVTKNKELNFEKNLQHYKSKNKIDFLYSRSNPYSVKIYNTLKELKEIACFINDTLPEYQQRDISFLVRAVNESFPTFEGYIKGIAVQELKSILDDTNLSAEDSLKAVASQLKNEATLEILGKNRQSETEYILKILSVVLIPLGIGIFPTVILVAKRLYDTGGTSINFFKPLSKNLCEDVENITTHVQLK